MADLIHRIFQMPIKRNNLAAIVGKRNNLSLAVAIKEKYKLEKRKQGYVIGSIKA